MGAELKQMAKMALQRLTSGFWQEEKSKRKKTLAILKQQGADTIAAQEFFVNNTKQQINAAYNQEDEALYLRAKNVFLSGSNDNALAELIDQDQIQQLDECARQRYIFNLSTKLQEFRKRFEDEQKFNYQSLSL